MKNNKVRNSLSRGAGPVALSRPLWGETAIRRSGRAIEDGGAAAPPPAAADRREDDSDKPDEHSGPLLDPKRT